MAFSKSKRALESELGSYSRLQKEISDKLRITAPASEATVNYGDENVNIEDERTSLLKQK